MIIGIDFGSSTTKLVLMDGKKLVSKARIDRCVDYTQTMKDWPLDQVTKIMITGTGSPIESGDLLGIPTEYVEEFRAVSLGGYFLSGYDRCLVVSLGTGTSFTYVDHDKREHAGGSGIGGALLLALSRLSLGIDDAKEILSLAENGNLGDADLLIKDISKVEIEDLYGDVSVANMAKLSNESDKADIAYGICNMVFQNVGVMAVLADRAYKTDKIVVMGALSDNKIARKIFDDVGKLFGLEFLVPEDALYGVAIGAVLHGDESFINTLTFYGVDDDFYICE